MARFRRVFSHDAEDQGPSAQALARGIEEICPVYEHALSQETLHGRISAAGLRCHSDEARDRDDVLVLVYDDGRPADHELVIVKAPPGIDEAPSADVRHLAAAVLTGALTRLGQTLQWNHQEASNVLEAARAAAVEGLPPADTAWAVRVEGRGVNAPEQPHELTFVGAGPTSARTKAYDDAFGDLATSLDTVAFQEWWSQAPVPIGEIWCWHDGSKAGVRVRLGRRVTATIERPAATIEVDHAATQARSDLEALLARLSQRLDLSPPPPLTEASPLPGMPSR